MSGVIGYPAGAPLFINSLSARYSAAHKLLAYLSALGNLGTGAWPSANLALYVPISHPFAYPVKRVFVVNGTTATGNWDLGLFSALTLTKLYSTGAVAQSGTSALQYSTVNWLVQPGEYYLALSLSSGSGTTFRTTAATSTRMGMIGCLQQATAHPLPSTLTPAAVANAYWPMFGLTRTTAGF
jgi:hypothetical protein